MKEKNNKKKNILIIILLIAVVIIGAVLLIDNFGSKFQDVEISNNKSIEYSNKLLKEVYDENKNTLVSDITLNTNLAFFYAEGNEKAQNELKNYFVDDDETIINNLRNINDRYKYAGKKVSYANSLWINNSTDDCSKQSKDTAKKLNYDIKYAKFNDKALNEMNKWIKRRSHGKIKEAIEDDISNAQSVLISTLYFNEKWNSEYEESDIDPGTFYGTKGNQEATFLSSEEEIYLEDPTAIGFMKPYIDEGLYFVGILPLEGNTIKDIDIESLMKTRSDVTVDVMIPEFEYEQTIDFNNVLNNMNIKSIFEQGNLDSIAKDLYVSKIVQKNYIKVNRKGTEAFSITDSITTQWADISSTIRVVLDHPFIFMIYDEKIDQVLFIGNVNNIE
ncbi:MAG: hypothetical protein IIZ67_02915 [Bacilli bacterium]|nr:hypothetical protein [Bacilli bacterium]